MKKLFILIIALLLFNSALAYDSWIYAGDSFEYDNAIFVIEKGSSVQQILMYVDDYPYILRLDECKKNYDLNHKYCIEEAAFEDIDKYETRIKYEFGEELFGYHLYIYDLVPELSVEREIRPDPEVDSISLVQITVTNDGEEKITSIKYQENITDYDFRVRDGTKTGDTYNYYLSELGAGQSRTFEYELIPKEYVSSKLTPSLSYVYDNQRLSVKVDPLSIDLDSPIDVTRSLDGSGNINEEFDYKLTFKNNEDSLIKLKVKLYLPENIEVVSLGDFKFSNGNYIIDESFGDELETSIKLKSGITGDYQFKIDIDAEVNNNIVEKTYYDRRIVSINSLIPTIQLSKSTFTEGEASTIRFYLENEDINSFSNIKSSMSSGLFIDSEKELSKILTGQKLLIKEISFPAPENGNYDILFEGTYESKNHELFSFEAKKSVKVIENKDPIIITQIINQTSAQPGNHVKVNIKLKNQKTNYLFLKSEDTFSTPAKTIGKTSAELTLEGNKEEEVYLYEVVIPETNNFVITTVVNVDGVIYSANRTIVVTEPFIVEQENIVEDIIEDQEITISKTENKGFFSKVWNWFVDFFK